MTFTVALIIRKNKEKSSSFSSILPEEQMQVINKSSLLFCVKTIQNIADVNTVQVDFSRNRPLMFTFTAQKTRAAVKSDAQRKHHLWVDAHKNSFDH